MRLLLVTGSYPPMKCGVGDYCWNLAQVLAVSPKIKVGILTSVISANLAQTEGIEIFPVIKKWSFSELITAVKIIRKWSPDIVHIQSPTQGYKNGFLPWILPMISFLLGKKVIETWHEGHSRRNASKLFLKSIVPSRLVFVRPNYKEILHPLLRWALWKKNTVFIQNASSIPRANLDAGEIKTLKSKYLKGQKRLIVFFGFVYPHKGVELLFKIADPDLDQIVIAGQIDVEKDCQSKIIKYASTHPWAGKVTITGFLPGSDVGNLLAVADAVIFPFKNGAGEWNTSIHGAVLNRAFVITTSLTQRGYDVKRNVYFAKINDIQEMQSALAAYAGKRRGDDVDIDRDEWQQIAAKHWLLYESVLS